MSRRARPSLADVAREAGVSTATASRALSQPEQVRAPTRARVQGAAERLGYLPDRKARALASGRSGTIGVVVPTLNSPIFAETLQVLQRRLYEEASQLLVASHEYDPLAEAAAAAQLVSHGVDGLILVGGARPEAAWRALDTAGVPVVLMWCGPPGRDCVGVDNRLAGELVARHLIGLGHREIGVITGHLRSNDRQRERLDGVRAALAEAGLALPSFRHSEQPLSFSGGRAGCAALLEAAPPPTAIIGTVDVIAIGAMVEAQARGLAVPAALSVAGIDNVDFAGHVAPSLTTVNIPAAELGARTAALVLSRIATPAAPETVLLPIDLVVRRSTAAPPSPAAAAGP
jgi:LacI family transcriptional regulator